MHLLKTLPVFLALAHHKLECGSNCAYCTYDHGKSSCWIGNCFFYACTCHNKPGKTLTDWGCKLCNFAGLPKTHCPDLK
ncbi:unnamed protein product [Cercospora beticola]|nr:unnamed protein product [Cercospora beticola]